MNEKAETPHGTLVREASRQMLGKESPKGRREWMKVINFIAWNVEFPGCLDVCYSIAREYKVPLKEDEIKEIVDFQTYDKAVRALAYQEKRTTMLSDSAIRNADKFFGDDFPVKSNGERTD
jgi:hypothetical protein